MTNKTFYSIDDETFDKEHVGEVIDEFLNDYSEEDLIGLEYYSAEFKHVNFSKYLDVYNILERADEYLYDNIGNEEQEFQNISKDASGELNSYLKSWTAKHLSDINMYQVVGKSTIHKITENDL